MPAAMRSLGDVIGPPLERRRLQRPPSFRLATSPLRAVGLNSLSLVEAN